MNWIGGQDADAYYVDTGRCLIAYKDSFLAFVTYPNFNHTTQNWSDWTSSEIDLNVVKCIYSPADEKGIIVAYEGMGRGFATLIPKTLKFVTFDIRSETYQMFPYETNPLSNYFISSIGGKILFLKNFAYSDSLHILELDLDQNATREIAAPALKNINEGISSMLLVPTNLFDHSEEGCKMENNSKNVLSFFPIILIAYFLTFIF